MFLDYAGAASVALLVFGLLKDKPYKKITSVITYSIILFLPTVVINNSLYEQCDMIYMTFAILSLYFLIEEEYSNSFVLLGIAFLFKLQFIFVYINQVREVLGLILNFPKIYVLFLND